MSRLLQTRLPISVTDTVESETYNRLVRVLELKLGEIDTDNIRQITTAGRDQANFNEGSIVWNTDIGALQVYEGLYWQNISTPSTPSGFEAVANVGKVTLKLNGSTTINV